MTRAVFVVIAVVVAVAAAAAVVAVATRSPAVSNVVLLVGEPRGIGPSAEIVARLCGGETTPTIVTSGSATIAAPTIVLLHNLSDYALLNTIPRLPRGSLVYTLPAIDAIANKAEFARNLQRAGLGHLIPETHAGEDLFPPGDGLWIWKTNAQRQMGVAITRGNRETPISDAPIVVRQRLLQDPLLVNGRKINLRVYVRFTLRGRRLRCDAFDDGFVYYTPQQWRAGSTKIEENVTTGYIDRAVYRENPLTLSDLRKHLGDERFGRMWGSVLDALEKVRACYEPIFAAHLSRGRHAGTPHMNVLGCDVAPSRDLRISLMEFNKTPDLRAKDPRDRDVKQRMVRWAFADLPASSPPACGGPPASGGARGTARSSPA